LDRYRGIERMTPVQGSQRRLQALCYMGWTCQTLAERTGISRGRLQHILAGVNPQVWVSTADKIAALYDELAMIPGPSRRGAQAAKAKGWVSCMAWDDIDTDRAPNGYGYKHRPNRRGN